MNGIEFPAPPKPESDPEEEKNPEDNQEELSVSEITEKIKNKEEFDEKESEFFNAKIGEIKNKAEKWREEDKNEGEIWEMLSEEEKEMLQEFSEAAREQILGERSRIQKEINNASEAEEFNELDDKGKKEGVENRSEEIKNDLTREGMEVKDDIEEFRKQREGMEEQMKKKFKGYAQMEEELSRVCEGDLLEGESKEKLKKIVGALRDISQTKLNLERFEYLEKSLEDIDSLVDIHNEKDFTIRKLEEVVEKWEELLGLLEKDLEELTEDEELVLKAWAQWIKDHRKELAVAGITIAGLYYGGPIVAGAVAGAAGWVAGGVGSGIGGAIVGGKWLYGGALYVGGKVGAGAVAFLGVAAVLGWLSQIKEEDIDDFMSKICGVAIPHRKKTTTAKS